MEMCPPMESLERLLRRGAGRPRVGPCRGPRRGLHHLPGVVTRPRRGGRGADAPPLAAALSDAPPARRTPRRTPSSTASLRGRRGGSKPRVDGYDIFEEIGRGGAGVVYLARHRELNRVVALKMVLAGVHQSLECRGRFRREAQAVARLQHPNIIQIYDVGEQAGSPYLALELVEGGNLAAWLGGSPRPAAEAARTVATLAGAVPVAHRQGVVHRDLKPANILMQLDGRAGAAPESPEGPGSASGDPQDRGLRAGEADDRPGRGR